MKKVLCRVLIPVLLLVMVLPVSAAPAELDAGILDAMNDLLDGVVYGDSGNVSDWSDETVSWIMIRKMIWEWDGDNPRMAAAGIDLGNYDAEGNRRVKRADAERIVRDAFGREFVPVEQEYMLRIAGDEYLFGMATGEHTVMAVRSFVKQGSCYVAVGCSAWYGGAGSSMERYFRAVFRENPDSLYGLTLVSIEDIRGNQSFDNVTATASSSLSGGDYGAENVLDCRGSTAWVEGASGTGVGEWIELHTTDGSQMELWAIELDPGYHKSEELLYKNGYPTEIMIETEDDLYLWEYCYSPESQVILFDEPARASWVRINIQDAEAGSKYSDTCISEIRLFGIDTEQYFSSLEMDLPEEAAAAEDVTQPPSEAEPETTASPTETEPQEEEPVGSDSGAASVGIIGGADGPTAIFATDGLGSGLLRLGLIGLGSLVLCAAIGIGIVLIRKKKK